MKDIEIISFVVFIIIISGCKGNITGPKLPVTYEPLFPLSIGNYWLYREYELNPDGSGGKPDSIKFGFIIDDTISQNINGNKIENFKLFNCGEELRPYYDKPGSFEGSKLIYQNKSGLYYSGNERYDTIKMSFNNLIFPYPVEKGETVSGHVFYYSTIGNYFNVPDNLITKYTCVSTDSIINTPIGNFSCIVYKMAYQDYPPLFRDEVYYFIESGIGIVGMFQRVYHYNTNQYTYIRKTLITDYKINQIEK